MSNKLKKAFILLSGFIGILYILNPTAGLIEIIPDNIPMIGNLDEAGAIFLVLSCLRYFNIDPTSFLKPKKSKSE